MKITYITLFTILSVVKAAPAPVLNTVYETSTTTLNRGGSFLDWLNDSPTTTTSTPEPTTEANTDTNDDYLQKYTTSSTPSQKFNLDSLLSGGFVQQWLNFFDQGSSDDDKTEASTPTTTNTPTETYSPTTSTSSTSTSTSTSTSSPTSDSVTGDKEFADNILKAHNKYRSDHDAKALVWDNDAYEYAQNNADNYDCSGVLTHTHGQFGENLAAGFSDGPAAVKAWYVEGDLYNYQSANTYNHFTQVVWKSTSKVGCAYKDCSSQGWGLYVVCEYDPPGNVIGHSRANVVQ